MKRKLAVLGAAILVFLSCTTDHDTERDALRRYVRAWSDPEDRLRSTITGDASDRLADALRAFREDGVEVTDVDEIEDDADRTRARVTVRFTDGASASWSIDARIEAGRVIAEPRAVWAELGRWTALRIERTGSPRSGRPSYRDGSRLPSRSPAIEPIRDALRAVLAGQRAVEVSAGGRTVTDVEPEDGRNVRTSLDRDLQQAAVDILGETDGALVAVDPRTGGIRAFASSRDGDDPERLFGVALESPGSTFKLVTAAAALEGDVLEPDDVVPCPASYNEGGRRIANFRGIEYGNITFERAFAVSCNTAFARIGVRVGTSQLLATARRLGFQIGRDGTSAHVEVPTSRSELGLRSFGAGGIEVSPLHMAGIGATIAHGGLTVTPGWTDDRNIGGRALGRKTVDDLIAMMRAVVKTGTGRNADLRRVDVAGKTGTADPAVEESDAWFVGLMPSEDTELVAVAFLPRAGIGGDRAAIAVARFFEQVASTQG